MTSKNLQPFQWYGSKTQMLPFLFQHMPKSEHHFVDVFGGSGVVLLNRPAAAFDTYNDLDSDLVNFFRTLRDDGDALIRHITLTPFSREELALACQKKDDPLPPLERARMFYCRAMFSFGGQAQTATETSFSYVKCISNKRRGMPIRVSSSLSHIEMLPEIVERLLEVQVENEPALEIVCRYDTPDTFFYCDPPYVHSTRSGPTAVYKGEMDDTAHEALAVQLQGIKGKAMVSGYRSGLYDRIFDGWRRVDAPPHFSPSAAATRQESIWMNYPIDTSGGLF